VVSVATLLNGLVMDTAEAADECSKGGERVASEAMSGPAAVLYSAFGRRASVT